MSRGRTRRLASRRVGFAVALSIAGWMLAGCAITTKLQSPLLMKEASTRRDDVIGLFVPESSRQYVWKGSINVVPYSVEFGNALEPNAKHALSRVFRGVVLLDQFPPAAAEDTGGLRAVSVEISNASVEPGTLTFSESFAVLTLQAVVADRSGTLREPLMAHGIGRASAGVAGIIPLYNQVAYNAALQEAAEGAMVHALEQLVDELARVDP